MSTDAGNTQRKLAITLPLESGGDVYVESVTGREALGECFAFNVDVVSRTKLVLAEMLGKRVTITIEVGQEDAPESLIVHGIILRAASLDPKAGRTFGYSFVVGPELALLEHCSQTQVYSANGDETIVDIIKNEMTDANKAAPSTVGDRPKRDLSHNLHIKAAAYPKVNFAVQYRESDLNFLMRMCEKYGIFFWFNHRENEKKEEVVFADRVANFPKLTGRTVGNALQYRSPDQILSQGDFAVRSFNEHHAVLAGSVYLREYFDEKPNTDLTVSAKTSFSGHGVHVQYGENYQEYDDGTFLAKRRAEALETQQLQYYGTSDIPALRPGLYFELRNHPIKELNDKRYIVTEVEHRVTELAPSGSSSSTNMQTPYSNRFVCIPYDDNHCYRPPLRTPKPTVAGCLLGVIDGEEGERAALDKFGRYRVRLMDDESKSIPGRASLPVRKMEPYGGGDGQGMHFPLLVGTEVAVGFLRGDPDRPIIIGALDNGEKNSPVTSANNILNRIKTTSGVVFQINDGVS